MLRTATATLLLTALVPIARAAVGIPVAEEDSFGSEMDRSSLPVLVISLAVLILVAIIGLYALLERTAVPH